MKQVKGILIDVKKQTVTEITIDDTLPAMYAALGCEWIESVRLINNEICWVDEEGQLKDDAELVGGFRVFYGRRIYFGNGLILGVTMAGENTDTAYHASFVADSVEFLTASQLIEIRNALRYRSRETENEQ